MDNNTQVQRKSCLTLTSQRPTHIPALQRTRFSQRVPTPRSFRLSNAPPRRDADRRAWTLTSVQQLPTGRGTAHGHLRLSNSFQRTHTVGSARTLITSVTSTYPTRGAPSIKTRDHRAFTPANRRSTHSNSPTGSNTTPDTTAVPPLKIPNRFQRESSPTLTSNPLRRPVPPNKYQRDFPPTLISQRPTDLGPVIHQLQL